MRPTGPRSTRPQARAQWKREGAAVWPELGPAAGPGTVEAGVAADGQRAAVTTTGWRGPRPRPVERSRSRAADWPAESRLTVSGDQGPRGAEHARPCPDGSREDRAASGQTDGELTVSGDRGQAPPPGRQSQGPRGQTMADGESAAPAIRVTDPARSRPRPAGHSVGGRARAQLRAGDRVGVRTGGCGRARARADADGWARPVPAGRSNASRAAPGRPLVRPASVPEVTVDGVVVVLEPSRR